MIHGVVQQGEDEAGLVLARAGLDDDEPVGAREIIARLLGPQALRIVRPSELGGADGEIVRVGSRWQIRVSSRLSPERAAFVALHELAHWHLGRLDHDDETETLCDAIAGALACPWRAFADASRELGARFDLLADIFAVEPSCAALRYGEVRGEPLALVSPQRVRVRGSNWAWGDERDVRRLAQAERLPPSLQRVRVSAADARIVLFADTATPPPPRKRSRGLTLANG